MYIYNVTVKVDQPIANEWLIWLKQEHIPEVLATQCFVEVTTLELLETNDPDSSTFAVQYKAANLDQYRQYMSNHAARLRQKGIDKWGDRFIAFRTFMKIVN
jgi:hypothetical protein